VVLVQKAVMGVMRLCARLLPYKADQVQRACIAGCWRWSDHALALLSIGSISLTCLVTRAHTSRPSPSPGPPRPPSPRAPPPTPSPQSDISEPLMKGLTLLSLVDDAVRAGGASIDLEGAFPGLGGRWRSRRGESARVSRLRCSSATQVAGHPSPGVVAAPFRHINTWTRHFRKRLKPLPSHWSAAQVAVELSSTVAAEVQALLQVGLKQGSLGDQLM
jgi:hypothetical protein